MFNFGVHALYVGGKSPYSQAFESLAMSYAEGIQSATISLNFPRSTIFGWDGGGNQETITRPRASLSLTYFPISGVIEQGLGLFASQTVSALSDLTTERNWYMVTKQNNTDVVGSIDWNNRILALGNGLLTHYELAASVGQPTVATATIEFLNALIQPSGTGQPLPAINKESGTATTGTYSLPLARNTISGYSNVNPSNFFIVFDSGSALGAVLSGDNACPLQNFNFSLDIPRQEIKSLGWAYPDTRSVQWPISMSISADAYLNAFQLDNINRFNCNDSGYNFTVNFNNPCDVYNPTAFIFKGLKLDNQTYNPSIGQQTRISLNWSAKIYDFTQPKSPNFYIITPEIRTRIPYLSGIFPQVAVSSGVYPLVINFGTTGYIDILHGPGIVSGNSIFVSDNPSTVTIRITPSGAARFQDIVTTVNPG